MASVTLIRPFPPSSTLFAMAADALVKGREEDAARLSYEGDLALAWELSCSMTAKACDGILMRARVRK